MSATALGYVHLWRPSPTGSRRTLLLLHGTGADEHDLLPVADAVDADANVLSPRGNVLEGGAPRFFRRFAPGVLDVEDLKRRTDDLAAFVADRAAAYGFDASRVVAFGYSNGANVAASLLFRRPETVAAAVLARAMLPYAPERALDARGKRVLLLAGARDPYSRPEATEGLASILRDGGGSVDVRYADAGHELTAEDVDAARAFVQGLAP